MTNIVEKLVENDEDFRKVDNKNRFNYLLQKIGRAHV